MGEINNLQDELKYCYSQIAELTKLNNELKELLDSTQREADQYKNSCKKKEFLLSSISTLIDNF